jgi:IS30 family transposase
MRPLTEMQRHTIARRLPSGSARKDICIATGKDKSILLRALKRNRSKRVYSPTQAQEYANEQQGTVQAKKEAYEQFFERIHNFVALDG